MEAAINDGGVPLRVEHSKQDSAVIGTVYEASVDERNQLHVKARLDKEHVVSSMLYTSMKQGAKMGLSVGGVVKRATKEFVESVGKVVKTFYDVALQEVSVTPRPANYDSWLVAKHITEKQDDGERFRFTNHYNDFLSDFPQLNYLQAFAKSIPDEAWHKVSKTNQENMETKKTSEETMDTEKAVSRSEFNQLASLMTKGFEALGNTLKKMSTEASDQDNPKEDKPKDIGDKSRKAMDTDAKDTVNPDKDKSKEIGDKSQKTKKTTANGTDEDGEREEKAEEEEETTKTSEEEEMEEKKKTSDSDDYDLKTVERAIKAIEKVGSRVRKTTEEEETTKTTEDEEDEMEEKKAKKTSKETEETEWKARKTEEDTETMKGMHPLDQFAVAVAKTLDAMAAKMEKSGKTVLGFEKSVIDSLRDDPEFQEELTKMMKVPGRKSSVSMGTPYVTTKEGKRYALTMSDVGTPTIAKSAKDAGSFKDVYKTNFSSIRPEE
jgi:hypothetical protein